MKATKVCHQGLLLLGFWLPAPVYALVEGAARILVVQP